VIATGSSFGTRGSFAVLAPQVFVCARQAGGLALEAQANLREAAATQDAPSGNRTAPRTRQEDDFRNARIGELHEAARSCFVSNGKIHASKRIWHWLDVQAAPRAVPQADRSVKQAGFGSLFGPQLKNLRRFRASSTRCPCHFTISTAQCASRTIRSARLPTKRSYHVERPLAPKTSKSALSSPARSTMLRTGCPATTWVCKFT
jgi:hypothetical protein